MRITADHIPISTNLFLIYPHASRNHTGEYMSKLDLAKEKLLI
uniref:Uncharacterized protein n=1 Tax=Candidatus Kentrum sp. TUN TaxID=2126343 RepID=A0A450ZDX2_9GAMM|nr:MAG: hypothetical protein BECKTUN1418D_GA0071000_101323 [Candidatus Kentron sp. TUN]VFK53562.1 MAG: hypothetical protein BECKTUN1418F_GA0071002_102412 [Candidatus Kentron sp. TUN]VFK54994.1 MAG: hypothetical protein BECKTUN1418E_GA0071001_102412 [Candidatus Kentron sp. TUN]